MGNPTTKDAQPPQFVFTCPVCKADPLIWSVLDGELPGTGMIIRHLCCSNEKCRAVISVFPVALIQQQSPLSIPGGRLPGKPLVDA